MCSNTDVKNRMAAISAMPVASQPPQSGWALAKTTERFQLTRTKINNQLQSTLMLISAMRAIRNPLFKDYLLTTIYSLT